MFVSWCKHIAHVDLAHIFDQVMTTVRRDVHVHVIVFTFFQERGEVRNTILRFEQHCSDCVANDLC